MATRTLTLEVPEELIRLVGPPEAAAALAHEALVMELLRRAAISQGTAARLLGRTRWDVLELMGKYNVESGPETVEESRNSSPLILYAHIGRLELLRQPFREILVPPAVYRTPPQVSTALTPPPWSPLTHPAYR